MGARVRAARDHLRMTQASLSAAVGFSDRQTLSAIENGERRLQAAELVKISQVLQRPLEWFIDPFVVEGNARFSWRVAPSISDEALTKFELRIGRMVGLFRHLKTALRGPSPVLTPMLRSPAHPTFEDAWSWGHQIAQHLQLGPVPALKLVEKIESQFEIPVLFIDVEIENEAPAISGAMCRLSDLEVIVINRQESPARRNFDVAHELFHALTWDAMTPEHREDPNPRASGQRVKRTEQLADNFAAALLMPESSLERMVPADQRCNVEYLSEVASELRVSQGALAFRLLNAKMIDQATCDSLRRSPVPKENSSLPSLLSSSFASLLHDGIERGHVSARKAAEALFMTLEQLATLLQEHGRPVPFAV